MSIKTTNVKVGNNLNAIVKGGDNVNAVVHFFPKDALELSTPQIAGGGIYGPIKLESNSHDSQLTIKVHANKLGDAQIETNIPANANELYVNLEGTYNGEIDIQCTFN
ncbi:hypothetical protein [uncultured Tenacibaculum sp.]|uniref:hypothetical protein n=1 Tax=uncultured Tenacibaculum sp. TaxID=174713 RepID=UPI002621F278|nr:hypothetical protein [uncultured Tenacibaculum sp.]